MAPTAPARKGLAVDIGGTFTDIVVESGAQRWTRKVLTTPQAPEQAVIAGTLELLAEIGVAPAEIDLFIHGTTLATNAIIERKGPVTALIATEGFRDVLEIAYESRYDQYDIFIDKPVALVPRVRRFTVPERIDAAGAVLHPLDEAALHDVERVRSLIDDLESKQSVAELLESAREAEAARIFIGSENRLFALSGSSVIAAPYRDREGRVVGVLGVIGPTRLNYARVVPMVDFTARSLGKYI